jgi:DNA-binding CsgD family transcriptional regulator
MRLEAVSKGIAKGSTVTEIATSIGIDSTTLYSWCKRRGIVIPSPNLLGKDNEAAVQRRAKIRVLIAEGQSNAEIAITLGCGKFAAQRERRAMGMEGLEPPPLARAIVLLYESGIPQVDIAQKLGCHPNTVHSTIRRFREAGTKTRHVALALSVDVADYLEGKNKSATVDNAIRRSADFRRWKNGN